MNTFGPDTLKWKTEELTKEVNFLDLTIMLDENTALATKTYKMEDNLYVHQTSNSCQPLSILKSFVYGQLHRYFWQNVYKEDFIKNSESFCQTYV